MSQNSNFSEETLYENGNGYKKFSCNLCEFTNTNKGGMKRHIDARHKNSGNKRAHEDSNDCDDPDKRPKIDEDFEPSLASTQIMMDEDDENDDIDEFPLADQNDLDTTSATPPKAIQIMMVMRRWLKYRTIVQKKPKRSVKICQGRSMVTVL